MPWLSAPLTLQACSLTKRRLYLCAPDVECKQLTSGARAAPLLLKLAATFPDKPLAKLQTSQEALADFTMRLIAQQRAQLKSSGSSKPGAV